MLANDLRQKYIDFFIGKGHLHLPSAPLVPIDALGVEDRSTLFTSAGMQQFKPYFVGAATPPKPRIVTVQKCVRTGDIDSVGDYSHCTFFEMLGNFSFGDYFKAEVIPWTWEFLTEWLGLDGDKLCVTVFQDDDEAFAIWHDAVGLPEDRIHRLGEDKNYWPANAISVGPNGPCGPCTEIFYRVAPLSEMTTTAGLTPAQRYKIDDDAGRWLEVWNNVFTQFDRQEDARGKAVLVPLPAKNNDTGAGFERIVALLQGKTSVFDTDMMRPVVARAEELSGRRYTGTMEPQDFAFRVVAEHARSTAFCIADGILPSNEGRGYVLRRVMRRAVRFGKSVLGFDEPFLHDVAEVVLQQMGGYYTELAERRDHILRTIVAEEERFRRTLDAGMQRLGEMLEALPAGTAAELPGDDAFRLYDTFGFPLELTREITAERGVQVDEAGFDAAMAEQRKRSQEAGGLDREVFRDFGAAFAELQRNLPPTEFVGYGSTDALAGIVAIVKAGELVDYAGDGDEVELVLDRTPFYAESGGQVGDTGSLVDGDGRVVAEVLDTQKNAGIVLHRAIVNVAELSTDLQVNAKVDAARRLAIRRNHTSTHLLHAALRGVLGTHVHQKGSMVSPDRLRFDYTHPQPMTPDELAEVERRVNAAILSDEAVVVHADVPIAEARDRGAMALFGEKYGDRVRVVEVPGVSVELCGGVHLDRTSQAGLLKITAETGVASGVRRIEAVTGEAVYALMLEQEGTLERAAQALKSNPRDLLVAIDKLVAQRSELEKQIKRLQAGAASQGELDAADVGGVCLVTGRLDGLDADGLSAAADREAAKRGSAAIVLGAETDGKVVFVAKVTPDLVSRKVHAGNLVRGVAKVAGGGGGGRPDFAQAGGKLADKLDEALAAAAELIRSQVGG